MPTRDVARDHQKSTQNLEDPCRAFAAAERGFSRGASARAHAPSPEFRRGDSRRSARGG